MTNGEAHVWSIFHHEVSKLSSVFSPVGYTDVEMQLAINDCIHSGGGTLCLDGAYTLEHTVNIGPIPASVFGTPRFAHMDIVCSSDTTITWGGAANTSMFYCLNWKRSQISGGTIFAGNKSGVVVFDLDSTFDACSLGGDLFSNVNIYLNGTNQIGYRLGVSQQNITPAQMAEGFAIGEALGDISMITWLNCGVIGYNQSGTYGFLNYSDNTLNLDWVGGGYSGLNYGYSNKPPGWFGSGDVFFFGTGMSSNKVCFDFERTGSLSVFGGRFENTGIFLNAGQSGGTWGQKIIVSGVTIDGNSSLQSPSIPVIQVNGVTQLKFDGIIYPLSQGIGNPALIFNENLAVVAAGIPGGVLDISGSVIGGDPTAGGFVTNNSSPNFHVYQDRIVCLGTSTNVSGVLNP